MSEKGSVFQKGGGGTNFEQYVQSAFLTTLIVKGNIPCIVNAQLIEIAFQTTSRGYQTDDLLAIAKSDQGDFRLLAQIKHNITFSDAKTNTLFRKVIEAFWKDFNNDSIFNKEKDRLVIIKSGLTKNERDHIKPLLNWAKTHANELDYFKEVNRIKEKKEYANIFWNVLNQINNGKSITQKDLWQFLRCIDLLEYDFLNEGSIDEVYFLNLIKLSKSNASSSSEKDIWDSIYSIAAKHNKDGGSITFESIIKHDIFKHFDILKITPFSKSIQKLRYDSAIIIKPLKSTIGDLHLQRTEIHSDILNSINDNRLTIVTGNPGVGKSAIVKEILEKDYFQAFNIIFRADQLNEQHLSNVFAKLSIHEPIQEIISCVSLIPDKLIVIDSLEKLLEGDPDNAFKQLLSLLSDYSDINIIATSRKYAVDLIIQKFGIENIKLSIINLPELNDDELRMVSERYQQLVPVLNNHKLRTLLRSPKYLDFALISLSRETEDLSNVSISDFKKKLWNNIIEDITTKKGGLARKRSKAFSNIAIKRAKEMKLFVEPDDNLEEGIEALEKDQVIIREKGEYKFSPTHDILEDWALIKYVQAKLDNFSKPKDLFNNLGNEPAIRRAFRLWIEDNLVDYNESINKLILSTLQDKSIDKYWADEILIAIFKSDTSASFFSDFQSTLLENEGEFLNRCIHIIRTACKGNTSLSILIPIGSGWTEILVFIEKHIQHLNKYRLSIANLLLDWEYRLVFQSNVYDNELQVIKKITIHFINQIESGDTFWQQDNTRKINRKLISLLFNLARVSKSEITHLIERSFKEKEERKNRKLVSFYENVIKICLSGLYTRELAKEMPELIVMVAWKEWKLKIPEESKGNNENIYFRKDVLRSEECWGIEDRQSFSPGGVYKTPIYNLLITHPHIGLRFIIEFLNYSIDFYVSAKGEYKHQIDKVEIELNDGSTRTLWAAWELWAAYRGLSVTHDALECILMSLEKYLLEIASIKTDSSKRILQQAFDYLLKNSNNVTICGLLCGVAIAHPDEVGKELLPLLTVKEFYLWDIQRSLQESSALSPMDFEISFAQKERHRLNQLPHRRMYSRGLCDFITNYQFNVRVLNKEIHQVFDRLKERISEEDVVWKKILTEIDVRNHEVGEYDKQLGGFPIKPKYDEEVTEFLNSNKDEIETQNTSLNYSNKIWKAHDGKEDITYDFWKECFIYYSRPNSRNNLYDRPVSLAVLGLRNYPDKLSSEEKEWCLKTIIDTNFVILRNTFERDYNFNVSYNIMEKETAIKSIHLVYQELDSEEDKNSIIGMIINLLIAPFNDHEVDYILEYVRNTFFRSIPSEAKRIWKGLIVYAEFRKANPIIHYLPNKKEIEAHNKKENDFFNFISSTKDIDLNIDNISFESYECYILTRALAVTPYYIDDIEYFNFINKLIPVVIDDLKKEEDYGYDRKKQKREIHIESRLDLEQYFAELLIISDIKLSKTIIDFLIKPIYQIEYDIESHDRHDLYDFVSKTLERTIYKLDEIIANSKDNILINKSIENFLNIWNYFYEVVKTSGKSYFASILFLDVEWKQEASHWKALEMMKDFYIKLIQEFGQSNSKYIINVFSTVGEKSFLPDGISLIVNILKANPSEIINLVSSSGERLIKRLFYNHILKIKNSKQLISDYIWILDNMIDLGSSEAYWFRENVITYKNK